MIDPKGSLRFYKGDDGLYKSIRFFLEKQKTFGIKRDCVLRIEFSYHFQFNVEDCPISFVYYKNGEKLT